MEDRSGVKTRLPMVVVEAICPTHSVVRAAIREEFAKLLPSLDCPICGMDLGEVVEVGRGMVEVEFHALYKESSVIAMERYHKVRRYLKRLAKAFEEDRETNEEEKE